MENDDRNKTIGPDALDAHKAQNQDSKSEEKINQETEKDMNDEVLDLDGDGLLGNTGGFYGGTSYIGSNYGEGWNADQTNERQNEGNFGAAGQQDASDSSDEVK